MFKAKLLFVFVSMLALAGCESFQSTEPAALSPSGLAGVLDDSLTVGRVNPAFVALGGGVAATVNLTLRDAAGGPLPGRVIALVSDRATDVIWPSSSVSDANGVVTFSIASGSVSAAVAASSGVVSSQLSYVDLSGSRQTNPARDLSQNRLQVGFVPPASAPARVSVVVGTPSPVTAGSPFPTITVGVEDNLGRPAAYGSYRVSVSLSPDTGGSAVRSAQVSLDCLPGRCTTNLGSNVLSTTRAGRYRIQGTSPALASGSAPITVNAAAAHHLSVVQQTQGGPALEVWPVPHSVQVVDQFENPVEGVTGTVSLDAYTTAGCGGIASSGFSGGSSQSLERGGYRFSNLQHSTQATLYLKASSGGIDATPCSGPITVGSFREARSLGWVDSIGGAPLGGAAKATVPFLNQPKVQVLDQYGGSFTPSPLITPSLAAYSSLSSCNAGSGPSYSLSPGTGTGTDGNGRFQFSGVQIASAGSFYFKATSTSPSLSSSCYGPVVVRAAPTPQRLVFSSPSPFPSTAVAGVLPSFGVGAIDQYDAAFTTTPCTIFVLDSQAYSDPGCSVSATRSLSPSPAPIPLSGVYSISGVSYTKAESIYLKATCTTSTGSPPVSTTLTQCSPKIDVSHASAAGLLFTPRPSPSVNAGDLWNAVVQVQDNFGNLVTSGAANSASIGLRLTGGVTPGGDTEARLFGPSTSMSVSGGVAQFNGLSVRKANPSPLPSYTLTASSTAFPGLTPAIFSFNVSPAAASQFSVASPSPSSSVTVGSSFQVSIVAQDRFGNDVPNYRGTTTLTSSDLGAILPGPCNVVDGHCAFNSMSLSTPGAQTLFLSAGAIISQIPVTAVDRCAAGGPYVGGNRVFDQPKDYSWAPFGDLSFVNPSPSPSMCPQVQVRLWGGGGGPSNSSPGRPGGYVQHTLNLDPKVNYTVSVGKFGHFDVRGALQGGENTKIRPYSSPAVTIAAAGGGASGGDPYNYGGGEGSMVRTAVNAPVDFVPEGGAGVGLSDPASPSPLRRQSGDGYAIAYWGSSIFKTWVAGTVLHLVGFNLASSAYGVSAVNITPVPMASPRSCSNPTHLPSSNFEHWTCSLPGTGWTDLSRYTGTVTLARTTEPTERISLPFSGPGISSLGVGADPAFLVDTRYAKSKTMDGSQFYGLGCSLGMTSWLNLVSDNFFNLLGFDLSTCSTNGSRSSGQYFSFNGNDQSVNTASSFFQNAVTAYTVEAFISTYGVTAPDERVIFGNSSSSSSGSSSLTFYIDQVGGGSELTFAAVKSSGTTIQKKVGVKTDVIGSFNSNWHHVVGTWQARDGDTVESNQFNIYLDGKKMGLIDIDTVGTDFASPLSGDPDGARIGWSGLTGDRRFMGGMSRVAVYNRVLSDNEIYEHCQRQVSRFSALSAATTSATGDPLACSR